MAFVIAMICWGGFSLTMADMHVAAVGDKGRISGCYAHMNLLLDGRTGHVWIDARLQVLLLVVTIFGNPRTGLILASFDLQSRFELATRVMPDTQETKDDREGECSDATYCFVHFLLLVNETLIVVPGIDLGRSL